jgi:hypothetical protein
LGGNLAGAGFNVSNVSTISATGNISAGNIILTNNFTVPSNFEIVANNSVLVEFNDGDSNTSTFFAQPGEIYLNVLEDSASTDFRISNSNVTISDGSGGASELIVIGNVSAGNFIVSESLIGSDASPQPTISGFSTISATGNISGGNLITSGIVDLGSNASIYTNSGGGNNLYIDDDNEVWLSINDGTNSVSLDATGNLKVVIQEASGNSVNVNFSVLGNGVTQTNTSIETTGNITGGNIITGMINNTGDISVTSNGNIEIIADNDNGAWGFFVGADGEILVSAANLATIGGGNLFSDGTVTSLGNVNAGNLVTIGQVVGTGNITGGNLVTTGNVVGNVEGYNIGYRDIPQILFTGNATMAAADAGKHFYSTESTDYILTIADNSAVSWPVGTAITVVNRGTGNITVAQAAGVSLYLAGNSSSGNRTVSTYGMVTLLNVAANVWMINGTGVA